MEKVTGSSLQRFSTRVLFAPIGATSALWVGRPLRGDVGLRMTPRDMARFGLLTLAGGRWAGGAPLVPPAHLRASLSTSQRMNPSYGYLWWLNGKPSHRLPGGGGAQPGPLFPNAPRDLVAALGAGDQKIYVVPSLDLVVVRQGTSAGRGGVPRNGFDDTWWKLLRRAVPRRA